MYANTCASLTENAFRIILTVSVTSRFATGTATTASARAFLLLLLPPAALLVDMTRVDVGAGSDANADGDGGHGWDGCNGSPSFCSGSVTASSTVFATPLLGMPRGFCQDAGAGVGVGVGGSCFQGSSGVRRFFFGPMLFEMCKYRNEWHIFNNKP
jgi:hypothetical protein